MGSSVFRDMYARRAERLNALLGRLQAETGWTKANDVHFMCQYEPVTEEPQALRMYVGSVAPTGAGDFNYVASIIPDLHFTPPDYYAETMQGTQAVNLRSSNPNRFKNHEELIAYLRACINAQEDQD